MSRKLQIEQLEAAIHTIRGERVMLDSDLAAIYGVTTSQLNQALKRNRSRFPDDFAFHLNREEFTRLKSQTVISKSSRGGRTKLPWAFTEHGTIMLASVLNSDVAVEASIRVVRAFIHLREMMVANAELSRRVNDLETCVNSHDQAITQLFAAIRQLISPPEKKKREIGFHARERSGVYRIRGRRIKNRKSRIESF